MSSPRVQYGYADGSANTTRAVSVTYPDGSVLSYDYGAANGDDDRLSRVQKIADDGVNLVEYSYYGQANVLRTKYPTPDVTLNFGYPSGVPYDGCLDRFGRVKQNPWVKGSGPIAGATYQYDRASSRTQMQPQGFTSTNAVERYAYDGLQRLTRSVRGSASTLKSQEAWGLDATGNWGKYDVLDVDTPAQNLAQQRTANPANEITDVTETYGPVWPTPAYDRAGNTTRFPQPLTPTSGYAAKYDAWNRLVEVKQGSTVVASYQYDGLNRRVTQVSGGTTRHFYYSSQWQVLEERTGTNPDSAPAERQFFWGIRYIDDLICRLTGSTRYYNCQDANWSTVAILDSAGAVQQRYRYSAYGTPTRLNPDGSVATGSDLLLWETLYAGYRYDRTTGLYQVRWRWLNPTMGAWITRDPNGYDSTWSLYKYVLANPVNNVDPAGLEVLRDDVSRMAIPASSGDITAEFYIDASTKSSLGPETGFKTQWNNDIPETRDISRLVFGKFVDQKMNERCKDGQGCAGDRKWMTAVYPRRGAISHGNSREWTDRPGLISMIWEYSDRTWYMDAQRLVLTSNPNVSGGIRSTFIDSPGLTPTVRQLFGRTAAADLKYRVWIGFAVAIVCERRSEILRKPLSVIYYTFSQEFTSNGSAAVKLTVGEVYDGAIINDWSRLRNAPAPGLKSVLQFTQ